MRLRSPPPRSRTASLGDEGRVAARGPTTSSPIGLNEAGEAPAWSEGIRDEWLLSGVLTGDREKRPAGSEKGLSDSLTPLLLNKRGLHNINGVSTELSLCWKPTGVALVTSETVIP